MSFPCSKTKNLNKIQCPYNHLQWSTWSGLWLTFCPLTCFPLSPNFGPDTVAFLMSRRCSRPWPFCSFRLQGLPPTTMVWFHSLLTAFFKCHLIKDGLPPKIVPIHHPTPLILCLLMHLYFSFKCSSTLVFRCVLTLSFSIHTHVCVRVSVCV